MSRSYGVTQQSGVIIGLVPQWIYWVTVCCLDHGDRWIRLAVIVKLSLFLTIGGLPSDWRRLVEKEQGKVINR